MNERIKKFIAESTICQGHPQIDGSYFDKEKFAELVRQDEREACAKVCDGWPDYDVQGLAEAIRARGDAIDISQEPVDETAKREHEPWVKSYCGGKPNYTTPPDDDIYDIWMEQGTCKQNRQVAKNATTERDQVGNRIWVGLTGEEYVHEQQQAWNELNVIDGFNTGEYSQVLWRRIEAKLKEKNGG